ncbi:glutaminyl-peptide cyclotransferase [Niabella ginsengisoli]|uniref:Glutaminyl-peptide cyclotransferase n=1 Tax=Niabella ginsengisoli TaxID=522298 RepID=A0ABS9SLR7_9BACT|nr:glutaminyl-peptide cyclotransferase [Niabella ginsengisoli]MCH5599319.1 glutaminyl-peptide cyclotransferase [Niabella ginsengisoli]
MKHLSIFIVAITITFIGCKDGDKNSSSEGAPSGSNNTVPAISISVIKSFPHDTSSFTQGLAIYKGEMYEGTGGAAYDVVGSKFSKLMKVDLQTGKPKTSVDIDPKYFGEGITILNDTVYQLTWREHKVFAYTLPDFKKVKEFDINTEGWGITTNGKELIVSDGSSNLYFYDPATFRLLHSQSVTQNGELSYNLNELEYIDGFVYANQWQQPYILKIDPNSGQISGRIDVSQIWNRVQTLDPQADVPNGIAYDAETKKVYITGKKWPELYEVQLGR